MPPLLPRPRLGSLTRLVARRHYSAPPSSATTVPAAKRRFVPTTGTYPQGFAAGSSRAGVKPSSTGDDIALVVASKAGDSGGFAGAAVFTRNAFAAAPVQASRGVLAATGGRGVRAVVVNSGCANAVTGKGGAEDAATMASAVDGLLGAEHGAMVMSTGVIGQRLPIEKITDAIPKAYEALGEKHEHWLAAARAICTTDTFPKLLSRTFTLPSAPGITYRMAGMTKGAGMIHPNMATLLAIICTDVPVHPAALSDLLKSAVERSFNSISIDGDMSTNDTLAALANGAAGGAEIRGPDSAGFAELRETLTAFAQDLAQLVVRDGEGATKFVTVRVRNARTYDDAKRVASTIARSPLVKTALYGRDANWGRILCATGYAEGVSSVIPEETSVSFVPTDGSPELRLLVRGEPEKVDEERAAQILEAEDLEIVVKLSERAGEEAVYWTCDFSHEYVTINGDYRT